MLPRFSPSLLGVLLGTAAVASAQLPVGDVAAAGFPAPTASVFRIGQWIPIQISLATQGSDVFSGQLRVVCKDLDGDQVAYLHSPVAVAPGAAKRFWCYATANATNELPTSVDVLNEDGGLLTRLDLPQTPLLPILHEDLLVLDISYPQIKLLRQLQTGGWSPGDTGDGRRDYYRNVVTASLAARDLPDRWYGLESVDVIVWDRPAPGEISLAQLDALVQWVHAGGQLILGIGDSWDTVRGNETLAPLLPLTGPARTVTVNRLDTFLRRVGVEGLDESYTLENPITLTTAQPKPDALRTLGAHDPSGTVLSLSLVTMHQVGSGRVTATAASLRDLTALPIDPRKLFGELLDLNPLPAKFKEKQTGLIQQLGVLTYTPLFDDISRAIGFTKRAAVRSLTAFLFVGGYILVATMGSWWWLSRQGRTSLSWTLFATFAIAASALSLFTVTAMRGLLSRGVQSVQVLDLAAGEHEGHGTCLFGYASPTRQRVDFTLPGDLSYLRPLPRRAPAVAYVTPARYQADPTRGRLEDVLCRATLKQFEGAWRGPLPGTLRADLVARRDTGRLTPASWIANDFDVPIAGGVLLYIDPRHEDVGVPPRAAGLTAPYDHATELPHVPPSLNVLAVRIPALPAGQQLKSLGQAMYADVDARHGQWLANNRRNRSEMPDLETLWELQQGWSAAGLTGLGSSLPALERRLLLASTFSLFLHNRGRDFDSVGTPASTAALPDLDVSHWLLRGQAVLLCWTHSPGPARLHRAGQSLGGKGVTLYRVRIPLRYEGSPPRPGSLP